MLHVATRFDVTAENFCKIFWKLNKTTFSLRHLPAPSRQSYIPSLLAFATGTTQHHHLLFFLFFFIIHRSIKHEYTDTPFVLGRRRPCPSSPGCGGGGTGTSAGGVHGVEEVQHGLPGHRRLLRLRRRRQPRVPRRQLLPPTEALRRRAAAHGWPRHASPLPQATGTYVLR